MNFFETYKIDPKSILFYASFTIPIQILILLFHIV